LKLLQIDAFTDAPFKGNPAAVCFPDGERDAEWMQHVAAEMNLSETAFLTPRDDGWSLRWFTPSVEVALCGHATLASAHALWQEKLLDENATARFHTLSGVLTADRRGEWIELDFPSKPNEPVDAPAALLDALGAPHPRYVGRNQFDYLVELESADAVRALKPDHAVLRQLPVRGVVVTARGDGEYDFVSRFFAPGSGVDEDPVTGSAHCALAPYWSAILDKNDFVAYQASARGGVVRVRLAGDRVKLGGKAVTVLRGELFS
jgi:PhzF family phenazine biosynthesis protein